MPSFQYTLFADYYQFYIQDAVVDGNLGDSWGQEAVDRLLAVAPGTVGIGTVRNMDIPVRVEVQDHPPDNNLDAWDHIVECSLEMTSTNLVIAGCMDYFPDAARIPIQPGSYRVRAYYGGLDTLSDNGLDGDDHYHLTVWPAPPQAITVLKQRPIPPRP